MAQASGSSAEIWYKIEIANGVTPSTDSGADTTLASAVNPGATQIVVSSATDIAVNDILKIGNDNNMEFVKVSSIASAPTIDLDSNTKINYRHESGEAVKETDPTSDWFKLGSVRSFTPSGGRELQRSQALTGTRVLSNFREGNYDAGADMTVEMDIAATGLFYMHALNNDYVTLGSSPGSTGKSLTADAAAGAVQITVNDATGISDGTFIQIGTGGSAEVIEAGTPTGNDVPLKAESHPNGLRKTHASTTAVDTVSKPFTHEIKRGSAVPEGISFLLRFTDIESLMLIRGNKVSNLTLNVDPSDLPLLNMNVVGKAFQILSENIFGTSPTTIPHTPYSHWEAVVSVADAGQALQEQTSNQFENLSVVIENTIQGNFVVGSPIKGAITPGEGNVSGSFTYQYGNQQFAEKTVAGTETNLNFAWTYIGDNNHSVEFDIPRAKFEGTPHPGVSSKDPITDEKSFLGRLDSSSNTDITVKVKNNQPTVEYIVEPVV